MRQHHSPFALTPWVRALLFANAAVFLLQITVFTGPWFVETFGFAPERIVDRWWTPLTYMFVHGGILHLAFNMLVLFVFGPRVEDRMGGGNSSPTISCAASAVRCCRSGSCSPRSAGS